MSHHWGGHSGWGGHSYSSYRGGYPYYGGYYGSYGYNTPVYVNSSNDSAQNAALNQHQAEIDRINAQNNAQGDSWVSRNWVALLIAAVLLAVVLGLAMRSGGYRY